MEIIKQELARLGELAADPGTSRKDREAINMVIRTFIEKHRQNPAVREAVEKNPSLLKVWAEIMGEGESA